VTGEGMSEVVEAKILDTSSLAGTLKRFLYIPIYSLTSSLLDHRFSAKGIGKVRTDKIFFNFDIFS